jgi:catecholate siderophore receptor
MNEGISSIQSGANDDRSDCSGGLQSNAIHAAEFTTRLRLRAAVSLASLMTVSAASAQEGGTSGLQLPTIDVTGDQGGYQATQQSINRLQTQLLNTPQTINVVPQQEIQERRLTSMEEALRTVPGITFSAGEGGQQGDSPIIRGFVARGDIFRDGIRATFSTSIVSRSTRGLPRSLLAVARLVARSTTSRNCRPERPIPKAPPPAAPWVATASILMRAASATTSQAALYTDVPTPTRDNVWTRRWGVAPSVTGQRAG